MRSTLYNSILILAILLGFASAGCTHNNGDIGSKFGSWKMTSLTVDGTPDPEYGGNIFWGFQHGSLTFTTINYIHGIPTAPANGEPTLVYTSWSEEDGYIIIDAGFSDNQGTFRYTPPAILRFPSSESGNASAIRVKILSETSEKMKLEYVTADGMRVVYTLQKWG